MLGVSIWMLILALLAAGFVAFIAGPKVAAFLLVGFFIAVAAGNAFGKLGIAIAGGVVLLLTVVGMSDTWLQRDQEGPG